MAQITPLNFLVESRAQAARLVINRPPLNILDLASLREFRATLENVLKNSTVRLVEFSGAGERAFCAGTDIRDHVPERAPELLREFHGLIREVLGARCPTVAIVRGHCLGGGMELAMACDFILAASGARFGQPEIKVGAIPPVASILLPKLIPEKKALEMILTGESIGAEEAMRLGLVNRVTPEANLEREAEIFSGSLLAQSPAILVLARRTARLRSRQAFEAALRETERIYLEELLPTEDSAEGIHAFVEKRPPKWKS
ncbi:MAG TPA: enoyl-CoA hydratase/isomerase family protein [Terriglobia bacterium]|nr:enoyl-CoA hydratase/isomerase family protein [Terriglobia bacterium]